MKTNHRRVNRQKDDAGRAGRIGCYGNGKHGQHQHSGFKQHVRHEERREQKEILEREAHLATDGYERHELKPGGSRRKVGRNWKHQNNQLFGKKMKNRGKPGRARHAVPTKEMFDAEIPDGSMEGE